MINKQLVPMVATFLFRMSRNLWHGLNVRIKKVLNGMGGNSLSTCEKVKVMNGMGSKWFSCIGIIEGGNSKDPKRV